MPMYHGMGMMQVGWAVRIKRKNIKPQLIPKYALQASTGVILTTFKPQVPAVAPTPDALITSFMHTKTKVGFCVPIFVEVRPIPFK